jgi:glycosyltransferase involved in cell wall biosynthesis
MGCQFETDAIKGHMEVSNHMRLLIINDNTADQTNGVVTTFSNLRDYLTKNQVTHQVIDPSNFSSLKGLFYPDLSTPVNPWKLAQLVDNFAPTHIHIATEGVLGTTAKLLFDHRSWKYTTSYHTRWDLFAKNTMGFEPWGLKSALRWFHSRSEAVLVTTPGMAHEVNLMGIGRTVVWSRGVDHDLFSLGEGGANTSTKPTILSVGRVSAEKNLACFCELDHHKYDLRMVGDGPILNMLREKYPHVRFDGALKGEQLAQAYQTADVLAFTSLSDTFGLVMIESMATGTPVAAFPVRGPIDVVDEGITGFLNDDVEQAIQACLTLKRNDVRTHSKKWSWPVVGKNFVSNLVPVGAHC